LRLKIGLQTKNWKKGPITITELKEAETVIYKYVQKQEFADLKHKIRKKEKLPKKHTLTK
jgi:hypothetical protein